MATSSVGAWKTAAGAAGDVFCSFNLFKPAYLGLFFCSAIQQFLVSPQSEKPADSPMTTEDGLAFLAVLGIGFFAVPFAIQLWRFFAAGDMSWSYGFHRPFWRVLGWGLLLIILAGLYFAAAFFVSILVASSSEIAGAIVFLLLLLLLLWIGIRLATFYPALSLDEPPPLLRRSFHETKGWVWFLVKTALSAIVVLVPAFALLVFWQIWIYGFEAFSNPDAELPPLEANMRFADAIVVGIIVAFFMIYQAAVSGRIYRAVRGL